MAQVSKWGNSLAVRLPRDVVRALDLKEGDELTMGVSENGAREFVVRLQDETASERPAAVRAMFERLRKLRGTLPADFKFDRDEANEMDRFDKWGPTTPKTDG